MYAYFLVRYVCVYLHSWKTKIKSKKNICVPAKRVCSDGTKKIWRNMLSVFSIACITHMRARATLSRTQYRQGCENVAILLSRHVILKWKHAWLIGISSVLSLSLCVCVCGVCAHMLNAKGNKSGNKNVNQENEEENHRECHRSTLIFIFICWIVTVIANKFWYLICFSNRNLMFWLETTRKCDLLFICVYRVALLRFVTPSLHSFH